MERNKFKIYQGLKIVLYSKSKNYKYYKCSLSGCKGQFREVINTGQIQSHKKHSTKCYRIRKLEREGGCSSHEKSKFNNEKRTIKLLMTYGLKKFDKLTQKQE